MDRGLPKEVALMSDQYLTTDFIVFSRLLIDRPSHIQCDRQSACRDLFSLHHHHLTHLPISDFTSPQPVFIVDRYGGFGEHFG